MIAEGCTVPSLGVWENTIMRRTGLLVVALITLAGALPAVAGDRTLSENDATPLSEHAIGQPYWRLEAQCAGLYGATANFYSSKGRHGAADTDTQRGVSFMDDAIARLQEDRRLDFEAALALAGAQVDASRAHSKSMLSQGMRAHSAWNLERSFCLDVYDAYHHHRG
jgi:hypothetical protein